MLMLVVTGIVCILAGVYAAKNAYKAYALVLAGTYYFQTTAIVLLVSALMRIDVSILSFVIPLVLAGIVWMAARLNFLWLWGSLTFVCMVILAGIGGISGEKIAKIITIETVGLCYLVGLIAAFILRKHGRVLVVSITSGYNVGAGLLMILMAVLSVDDFDVIGPLMFVVILSGIAAGIYYQYKIDRRLIDGETAPTTSVATDIAA